MKPEEFLSDYQSDRDASQTVYNSFDEKESMLISKVEDSITNSSQFKSRVTDSRLSTIIWERSGRVMGQLPTGQIKALTKADKGKSMLMDMVLQRYIIPNADSQHPHLLKLRMWDLYSLVYGAMPMMYDYRIDDGYVGPDSWLIPVRNFVPQWGKMSISESDHAHVDTYVSVSWLKAKLKAKGDWKVDNIKTIIKHAQEGTTNKKKMRDEESYVERTRENDTGAQKGNAAQVKLTTRYESGADGRWVTFAPDYDNSVIRDIPNPHKNNRIPVVMKYCFPLLDSIWGLGDFERGKTLQFAMDSLINLYMDGVKMSIFPPTVINPNGVVPSSIRYSPGARWLETAPNSIRTHQVSPQGLTTFQNTYQFLIGSMLNQNGTTDVAANSDSTSDPGFGKTPEALKLLSARENTRDNWDRFMMEQSVEELYNGYVNLVSQKQPKSIDFHLFGAEIEQVEALYPDIDEIMEKSDSEESAKLTIDPKKLKDVNYRYYIDAGSTLKKDEASQAESLSSLLVIVSKIPGLNQELAKEGVKYSVAEHMKRIFATSGVDDYDKIIYPMSAQDQAEMQMQDQAGGGGNLNQPPQMPGQMGGDVTPPAMAEPQAMPQAMPQPTMQAPAGVNPNTVPAQANPETGQFAYMPQNMNPNPNGGSIDPEIQAVANQMFNQ